MIAYDREAMIDRLEHYFFLLGTGNFGGACEVSRGKDVFTFYMLGNDTPGIPLSNMHSIRLENILYVFSTCEQGYWSQAFLSAQVSRVRTNFMLSCFVYLADVYFFLYLSHEGY